MRWVVLLLLPVVFSLSILSVHSTDARPSFVSVLFRGNEPISFYEANATVQNSTMSMKKSLLISDEGYGLYRASGYFDLEPGIYDMDIKISNSTDTVDSGFNENLLVSPLSSSFSIIFNVSVSADPSFDKSYIDGKSDGRALTNYIYINGTNQTTFMMAFPESYASITRTPYSIIYVNSSLIYLSIGNDSSPLSSFADHPRISIFKYHHHGIYRVVLSRDDVKISSHYCQKGERKIVLENTGESDRRPVIEVDCI